VFVGHVYERRVFLVVAVQFAEFELRLFGLQTGRIDTGFEVDGKAGVRFDDLGTGVIPGRVCRRLDELGGSVSQIAQQTHGDFRKSGASGLDFLGSQHVLEGKVTLLLELPEMAVVQHFGKRGFYYSFAHSGNGPPVRIAAIHNPPCHARCDQRRWAEAPGSDVETKFIYSQSGGKSGRRPRVCSPAIRERCPGARSKSIKRNTTLTATRGHP
jgi:hypothetical protein